MQSTTLCTYTLSFLGPMPVPQGVGEFLVALPNIPGIACSGLALALCFVFPRRG